MVTALLDVSVLGTATRSRGIGRYVSLLADGLSRLEADDLHVMGLERVGFAKPEASADLGSAVRRNTAEQVRSHYRWAYALRLNLSRAVRQHRPDVVHTPHPNATPLGPVGCPRITTCHDLIPLRYPEHYSDWREGWRVGRRALDHRRYHSADHIIAVSSATADDLMRILAVPASKISVVPNGIPLERWRANDSDDAALLEALGVGDKPFLLCVGPPEWRKNPDNTLAAFAEARRRAAEPDLTLLWVSHLSTEHEQRLRALAEQHGVGSAVRPLGYVPDSTLRALYRHALALLFVSRCEGFGYPLAEAMAVGCPAVTSNGSSLAEIAGDAALCVDPERPGAITSAVIELVQSASLRAELRSKGLVRADRFGLTRMAEATAAVYRQVARA